MKKPTSFSIEEGLAESFKAATERDVLVDPTLNKSEVISAFIRAFINNQVTVARIDGANAEPQLVWLGEVEEQLVAPTPSATSLVNSVLEQPTPEHLATIEQQVALLKEKDNLLNERRQETLHLETQLRELVRQNTELEQQLEETNKQIALLRTQLNKTKPASSTQSSTNTSELLSLEASFLSQQQSMAELVLALLRSKEEFVLNAEAETKVAESIVEEHRDLLTPSNLIPFPLVADSQPPTWLLTKGVELETKEQLPTNPAFTLAKSCYIALSWLAENIEPSQPLIEAKDKAYTLLLAAYEGLITTPDGSDFELVMEQISSITEQYLLN